MVNLKLKNNILKRKKSHFFNANFIVSLIIISIITLIIINPPKYINSCNKGLLIWASSVLPSLFPFLLLTKVLIELNAFDFLTNKLSKITYKLFKAPKISSYVFLLSILSGYPVGAKIICDLYEKGAISSKTATKLTTFCSTSGPLFILGTVGAKMFNNFVVGYIILISHIIGSVINGIIYRNLFLDGKNNRKKIKKNKNKLCKYAPILNSNISYKIKKPPIKTDFSSLLSSSMTNAILSIMVVGGFITIFYMLIDMLFDVNLLTLLANFINLILKPLNLNVGFSICSGLIEVTRGCFELSNLGVSNFVKCVTATGLITFGGLSIHFQALTFLSKAKVNIKFYFMQKLTHTLLSVVLAIIFGLIFL